ncbi:cation:H+ antiporter [Anaerobacterium chartisolvens]|uniref:Cation:H+ antiporter n=1 Tax=Anaerobacterium chartisolvens TaxID=1297424 RepID=A0A369AX96_9FIRM|nr:sodium:calcium antiporter [Anaerobacterium chartisolvens]RCX13781.1 cation:H+ antiporter [Anaerobacterium chartisolvens]
MLIHILGLVLSLAIILVSCELFTNGIEWLGKRLNMGDGVVGSILSAVGTCLPETMIPIIAIFLSGNGGMRQEIGIGAIIGAPFMLSTLAFFLSGLSVLVFYKKRKSGMAMLINNKILGRDLSFFIIAYSTGICAGFINALTVKYIIAVFLICFYIYYIAITVKNDKSGHLDPGSLYLGELLNMRPALRVILLQIFISLLGIVLGAHLFVNIIEDISGALGLPVLVLSIIIAPVATELPEKFNSVIWISKKKDTLALGNITGAMVFQACIPVSIGILATSWRLDMTALVSFASAILSSGMVLLWLRIKGRLTPLPLLASGLFYVLFLSFIF